MVSDTRQLFFVFCCLVLALDWPDFTLPMTSQYSQGPHPVPVVVVTIVPRMLQVRTHSSKNVINRLNVFGQESSLSLERRINGGRLQSCR